MNNEPIIVERIINAPSEKVWQAITDKNVMIKWGFDVTDFEPEVGFEFRIYARKDDTVYEHICVVQEVIEGKKLSYSWWYEGYVGDSLVTFELFPEDGETKVRLTHEGIDTISVNGPDFARENFVDGWTAILGILKGIVEE
jgi:uncharacterized protein YndB with AHSA1/START domain